MTRAFRARRKCMRSPARALAFTLLAASSCVVPGRRGVAQAPAAAQAQVCAAQAQVCAAQAQATAARARLTAAMAPDGNEYVLTLGPVDLPSRAEAGIYMVTLPAREVRFPGEGWLLGYRVELVDSAGRRVNQMLLHHVDFILPERRELFSPIMMRLGAAGHETSPVKAPFPFGIKIRAGERILVKAMFTNQAVRRTYHNLRLRVHMPFVHACSFISRVSVYPFYFDAMPPAGDHSWTLPSGKSRKSYDARPAIPARIIGIGGHLHRYATLLRFEDVTAHKVIWQARPVLDSSAQVVNMPRKVFLWTGGVEVTPQHVYRLTAYYDNTSGHSIPDGGMAAVGGGVIPSHGGTWPAVDPSDPEYRKDVEITFGSQGMPGMHADPPPAPAAGAKPAAGAEAAGSEADSSKPAGARPAAGARPTAPGRREGRTPRQGRKM